VNLHPQLQDMNPRLRRLLESGFQGIKNTVSRATHFILPAYNSKKNVGRQTQRNYHYTLSGEHVEPEFWSITTLDLLTLYFKTGYKITGPLEVRQAWFFNDLKPRTYYCLGGTSFWDGLYIQDLANFFCKILPSTNPFSRFTVSRVGTIGYDQLLITYDYTSFTTSLAELKFFIFWLSTHFRGTPMEILDVRLGLVRLDVGQLLYDYNEAVNNYQAFSLERFFQECEDVIFFQGRSGSLGVKGNIVFSTFLHGMALGDITGTPDSDCCVGDDALVGLWRSLFQLFISCVNNLGDINPDKFISISRPSMDCPNAARETFKFLKRPIFLDAMGSPNLGVLDFFPSIADALHPEGDGIHTASFGLDRIQSVKTFVMQWGRFLNLQRSKDMHFSVRDEDLESLLSAIQAVYKEYGLPYEGAIPGVVWIPLHRGAPEVGAVRALIPPCDTIGVFDVDWLETLLFRFAGDVFTEPVRVGGSIPPPVDVVEGETFAATCDIPVLSLMEDIGCVTKELYMTQRTFDETYVLRIKRSMGGGLDEPMYAEYTVVNKPHWWFDVCVRLHPDLMYQDPMGHDRASSIFSGEI